MRTKVMGFSAVIFPEEGVFSCVCPELNVASWGTTVEEAVKNLREAVQLHLECLPKSELNQVKKCAGGKLLTTFEVPVPA
ncbi:type II toxin-antitoxin system HicB family antitoxin [Candidatus Micrarchaeota archaeon]|nr:type II toxin-antitoxin system HicB family antitoxin [Candidatus Micrarchaeota archaeon]